MKKKFVLCKYLSHPDVPFTNHIDNMISEADSEFVKNVKIYHDLGKLRDNFQKYIRGDATITEKEHSVFGAYVFLKVFYKKIDFRDLMFGFISIKSHHQRGLYNFDIYIKNLLGNLKNYDAKIFEELNRNIKEIKYFSEVDIAKDDIENKIIKINDDLEEKEFEIMSQIRKDEHYFLDDYLDFRDLFSIE